MKGIEWNEFLSNSESIPKKKIKFIHSVSIELYCERAIEYNSDIKFELHAGFPELQ